MRWLAFVLSALLAGCAGNVADYIGRPSDIITAELVRYGLGPQPSRCVGAQLGARLTPLQLRRFQRVAALVQRGYFDPARLTLRDLMHVASTMSDPQVRLELSSATAQCGLAGDILATAAPAAAAAAVAPVARAEAWLNLGAAPTGQAIAVDASTIEQQARVRKAWFRLTNPGVGAPTGISYHLRVDCAAKTIKSIAQRNAAGEYREYGPPENNPLPVEGGTVMEIAWLALCT